MSNWEKGLVERGTRDGPVCFSLINVVSLQIPPLIPAGQLNHNNTWPAWARS